MREPTDDDRDQDRRDRAEAWTEARRRFEDGDGPCPAWPEVDR